MSELEVAPDVVARLVRVLDDGADDLAGRSPAPPDGLGGSAAARELTRHATLAQRHLVERLTAASSGLRRCGDGVTGFAHGVRAADDALAARLAGLARDVS